ncbi:EME1 PROTEIN [Salix purpurea]|uniref:EME1 PROTEIN n=1 Tax=Salix purpurea TaxID=77065 RepID=A0A9Q0ZN42_SALPP|nr:EME1 PROTEIN [Salix purpurea]
MWNPIILSDEEENPQTPLPSLSKKPRTLPDPNILVLDVDDPTPHKSPSFVPDTPMSDVSIVKCTFAQTRDPNFHPEFIAGNAGLICLESENDEPESAKNWEEKTVDAGKNEVEERRKWRTSTNFVPVDCIVDANVNQMYGGSSSQPSLSQDDIYLIDDCPEKENFSMEQMANTLKERRKAKVNSAKENKKKLKKEQEKLQKAALKAQAAELKKMEKELQKWEKGKFALNSIVAEFDTRVIEHGSVGGLLLTKFADKGLTYRITSNPIERSILWTMSAPEHISQLSPEGTDIRYVALVYEAEDFCNLIMSESLLDHVSSVRSLYPSHTICYLTIRLMSYVNKRGKEQYKKQENDDCWRCPSVEEVLAKLTTHFVRVHYRLCTDEAELADHVFGLTRSLASCQFRKKLTQLSVNANGSFIPKDFIDRNLIKRSPWLKALVAIPKVQPRFAIAIWKKYPTMKSLLSVYMDPNKSVSTKKRPSKFWH